MPLVDDLMAIDWISFAYAATVAGGGIMGYVKASKFFWTLVHSTIQSVIPLKHGGLGENQKFRDIPEHGKVSYNVGDSAL